MIRAGRMTQRAGLRRGPEGGTDMRKGLLVVAILAVLAVAGFAQAVIKLGANSSLAT